MSEEDDDNPHVFEVWRDNSLHVVADKCKSCIFRSVNDGRIMGLNPGRVSGMVLEARQNEGVIPCHNTIHGSDQPPAICKGYWDLPQRPAILQMADRMGVVTFDPVPE